MSRGGWPHRRAAFVVALAILPLLGGPRSAGGHDVDVTSVARVFLDETGERTYRLSVVDALVPAIRDVPEVLPAGCRLLSDRDPDAPYESGFAFECSRDLTFDDALDLPWDLAGVVVVARWADGTEASSYFRGEGGRVPVRMGDLRATAGSWLGLAGRYFELGVEHILFGIDHLLFVLGLLLLVHGSWTLVKTVTAFTIAHSVTLGAAVLGVVPVRAGPVEAAIALSIVLLAREIVMERRGTRSLVHRKPWVVAFAFGLLHGLGFAGALGEIGLRPADVPSALLFFNLGVEAGQLAFVFVVLAAHRAVTLFLRSRRYRREAGERRSTSGLVSPARGGLIHGLRPRPVLGYALGALAMLWFFERLPAIWGA